MAERTQIDHAAAYHYEPKRMEDVNMLKTLAKEIRQYKKSDGTDSCLYRV